MFEASNAMNISCLTWNLEGFSRSKYSLKNFLSKFSPDFVFLTEPMLYQCDEVLETNLFKGEYSSSLSSDDLHDMDLPLMNRAKGGTMALWKKSLENHVFPCRSDSSSFLPIVLHSSLILTKRYTTSIKMIARLKKRWCEGMGNFSYVNLVEHTY